jgi:hypothetical protein
VSDQIGKEIKAFARKSTLEVKRVADEIEIRDNDAARKLIKTPGQTKIEEKELIEFRTHNRGERGEKGNTGDQGATGPRGPGGSETVVWEAPTASTVWLIEHGLQSFPSVTTVDSAGSQIMGTVEYLDINSLKVTFAYATAGNAYLN